MPDTLEEMEPLFAALAHGCLAGKFQEVHDEVYDTRIRRGNDYYIIYQLGAFGSWISVLSNFFDKSWHSPTTELRDSDASVLLNNAGIALRAVGRLRESLQPMQAALKSHEQQEDWEESAKNASNLSEHLLSLGDVTRAVEYGRQSVEFADRSGDGFEKESDRTTLADALHRQGGLSEAESLFSEAETMQKGRHPEYPYLYSLRGYQYCDLLLSQGWYGEVRKRASNTIKWEFGRLFDTALDSLAFGRSYLLQTVTEKTDDGTFDKAEKYLNRAVEGLRAAGHQEFIACGLIDRAHLHRVTHDFDQAHADLEEVREIAERSEMKLFLADYHLESARLARDRLANEGDPNLKPDLQTELETHVREARKLIEETGYGRREGELAELERD